ncbi:MAG: tRNA lysidine(34) synthetase TilS [Rhodospirillales bacterium]|nr:tRNA lysidine(34) synthetase TilS [Rhodospirillales bacterium]
MSAPAPSADSLAPPRHPSPSDLARPLTAAEFDAAMAGLGPWEDRPRLAAAVSGGPDSLCLTLLANEWATARGGEVIGLTVDHGLRPDSAAEAGRVGEWLGARGIRHQILNWRGAKPDTGIQAAARHARYRLLNRWVREHGCLHLLLAHTRDDQAETFVMRLGRGSGLRGLAAMPAVSYGADARLLRPLLGIRKSRLMATLRDRGQHWIDDPSNDDIRFERVRTRGFLARLENGGFPAHRLSDAATAAGRIRMHLDRHCARALAHTVAMRGREHALVDRERFARLPEEIQRQVIGRLLAAVGGAPYEPRGGKLKRLLTGLRRPDWRGATLGGCRLSPDGPGIRVTPEGRRKTAGRDQNSPISGTRDPGYNPGRSGKVRRNTVAVSTTGPRPLATPLCETRLYLASRDS